MRQSFKSDRTLAHLGQFENFNRVSWNVSGITSGYFSQVFLEDQVSCLGLLSAELDVRELKGDGLRYSVSVEQYHGHGIALQLSSPHLNLISRILEIPAALDAQLVLVDRDDLFISQNFKSILRHLGQVAANQQRGFHQGPERKMCLVLAGGHAAVSDLQHVCNRNTGTATTTT